MLQPSSWMNLDFEIAIGKKMILEGLCFLICVSRNLGSREENLEEFNSLLWKIKVTFLKLHLNWKRRNFNASLDNLVIIGEDGIS